MMPIAYGLASDMNYGLGVVTAMQKMLRHWLNKYPDETGNYIDDMVVATKGDRQHHQQIVGELLQIFQENSYFL